MKKKICIITGTRADYGIFYPVMQAIQINKNLKLHVIVTAMHLMREFGYTVTEIERDGFNIHERVNMSYTKDTGQTVAFSIGKGVSLFSISFQKLKPDIVMILGDRGEALAAAVAANYMMIPVAHIHGGEVSGHIDGVIRHAITKMAHIHFTSTKKAKRRIERLGEEAWRVHTVGAPALDRICKNNFTTKEILLKKYRLIEHEPMALLLQHPVATELEQAENQMYNTLDVIIKLKLQTVIIYPNADAGGRAMIRVLRSFKKYSFLHHYKSIPHKDYLGLLSIANVLIGNSSSGIIEAPSFKLPVINIGTRQEGRERSQNVIDVSYNKKEIMEGIKKAVFAKNFRKMVRRCQNVYGDGKSGNRIANILSKLCIDNRFLNKKITY